MLRTVHNANHFDGREGTGLLPQRTRAEQKHHNLQMSGWWESLASSAMKLVDVCKACIVFQIRNITKI